VAADRQYGIGSYDLRERATHGCGIDDSLACVPKLDDAIAHLRIRGSTEKISVLGRNRAHPRAVGERTQNSES